MNKTNEYKTFVEPKLEEIFHLCQHHEIPFLSLVALESSPDDGHVVFRLTHVNAAKEETPELFPLIMALLHERELCEAVIGMAQLYLAAKSAKASQGATLN